MPMFDNVAVDLVWSELATYLTHEAGVTEEAVEKHSKLLRSLMEETLKIVDRFATDGVLGTKAISDSAKQRLLHIIISNVYNNDVAVDDVSVEQILHHLSSEGWQILPPK